MWPALIYERLLLAAAALFVLTVAGNETRSCDTSKAEDQCGLNERCVQDDPEVRPYCDCLLTYQRVDGSCVKEPETVANATMAHLDHATDTGGGSSVAAGLLVPTFLIVIGVLLYFGARRYKWVQRFRQFRQNCYGNVLVTREDEDEEDDDDPPIAP